MEFLRDFSLNAAILIVLIFIYSRIYRYLRSYDFYKQLVNGVLFSCISIIVMSCSIPLLPGLVFDTRSVIISTAALFGGPICAAITAAASVACRYYLGGQGMVMGVSVIMSSALLGTVYYYLKENNPKAMAPGFIFLFGLIVHLVMLLCAFTLRFDVALKTIKDIGWIILIVYPIISFAVISLMKETETRINLEDVFRLNLENYRELVNDSSSIILRMKPDCTVLFINEYAQKFFGYTSDEIIGKSVIGTIVPVVDSKGRNLDELLHKIARNPEKYYQNENENLFKNGKRCWMAWTHQPVYDKNGNLSEIICVGVEITERKMLEIKLEEQKEELEKLNKRFNLAVESANIGVWELDLINDVLEWSDSMFSIYGISRNEFRGDYETWKKCVHPDDMEKAVYEVEQIGLGGKKFDTIFRIVRKNGEIRYVRAFGKVSVDIDGKPIMLTGVNYDITELRQTQETLAESELKYSMLFENMTVGFASHEMVYDEKGNPVDYRFMQVNPAFEKLTGLKAEKIVGKTVKEVLPHTEAYWIEEYGKVAKTGKPLSCQNYSRELDKYYDVLAFSPRKDAFAVIFSDVTQQKRLEYRRDLSNKVLALLNTNIITKEEIYKLAELFKEFSLADAVGIRIRKENDFPYYVTIGFPDEFIDTEDCITKSKKLGNETSGKDEPSECNCYCEAVICGEYDGMPGNVTDKGSIWINDLSKISKEEDASVKCVDLGYKSLALIPITKDEEVIGVIQLNYYQPDELSQDFVGFIESIGQSIGIALDRINDYNNLEIARKNAEAASKVKSEFLSMMSHELRTPLNGIIGFGSVIENKLKLYGNKFSPDDIHEYLKIINECGNSLTGIINDILELSSIEAGQMAQVVSEFDPISLFEDCLEIFRFKLSENETELDFQHENLPDILYGDSKRLKQVVYNIVGNAVKFTDKGTVTVKVRYEDGSLIIEVKDTGIGIPAEMQKAVFEPFTQVDQTSTRVFGGTGLGLTIVSRILESLKGTMSIDSEPGKGTVVTVAFPVDVKRKEIESQTNDSGDSLTVKTDKSLKVLVVEDSMVSILYLRHVLEEAGVEFKIAESFADVKEICGNGFVPDVALVDIALPDEDGFVVIKWLKEKFQGKKIRYVAQTAHVSEDYVKRYEEAGFDDFIGKPYRHKEILDMIFKKQA